MTTHTDNTEPSLLIGWERISRYCGVSVRTDRRWGKVDGLPVAVLPDGRRAVTKSLIDQWVLARTDSTGRLTDRMAHARQFAPNNQAKTAQDQAA